jgi:hypothetical protein
MVICKYRKISTWKLNIKHDLIFNGYPQHFIDSIIKPGRSNLPSSNRTYHGTVITPYVMSIPEKFQSIRNCINVSTISKNKHTLHATMMKNGPVQNAQQTGQCVHSIPYDSGRC